MYQLLLLLGVVGYSWLLGQAGADSPSPTAMSVTTSPIALSEISTLAPVHPVTPSTPTASPLPARPSECEVDYSSLDPMVPTLLLNGQIFWTHPVACPGVAGAVNITFPFSDLEATQPFEHIVTFMNTALILNCQQACLDAHIMNAERNDLVKLVRIDDEEVTQLSPNLVDNFYNLEDFDVVNVEVTSLPPTLFERVQLIRFGMYDCKKIRKLPAGLLANQRRLERFDVNDLLSLTELEPGLLDNATALSWFGLSRTKVDRFPGPVFAGIQPPGTPWRSHALKSILMPANQITVIARNDFIGAPNVAFLALNNNPIFTVDIAAFDDLLLLSSDNISDAELTNSFGIKISRASQIDTFYTNYTGAHEIETTALVINVIPRVCSWVGPRVIDIKCLQCTLGFELEDPGDPTSACMLPPFGPVDSWSSNVFTDLASTELALGVRYNFPSLGLTPTKDSFTGYGQFDYDAIRFKIRWNPAEVQLNLDCSDSSVFTQNTSNQEAVVLNGTQWDRVRTTIFKNEDRPAFAYFKVKTAGLFTIQTCDSLYDVSVGLYWHNPNEDFPTHQLYPDGMNDITRALYGLTETVFIPWHGGCDLSWSASRTVELLPGTYVIVARGHSFYDDVGGLIVVQMGCVTGELYDVDYTQPDGLIFDERSGELGGIPQTPGTFNFEISATDFDGTNVVLIPEFEFTVVQKSLRLASSWAPNGTVPSRNLEPKYHLNELHRLAPPEVSKEDLFDEYSGSVRQILFALTVDPVDPPPDVQSRPPPRNPRQESDSSIDESTIACDASSRINNESSVRAMIDSQSGAGVLEVYCAGWYRARLGARDASGSEVVVNEWHFEALPEDTLDESNGPGGMGCGAFGTPVDDVLLDFHFTCQCQTSFTGDNCNQMVEAENELSDSTRLVIGITIGGLLFIMFTILAGTRVQVYRLKHRPLDMAAMRDEVLQGLGMSHTKGRIGENEFGICLTFTAEIEHISSVVSDFGSNSEFHRAVLAEVVRIVPRLSESAQKARALASTLALDQILVVIPRPTGLKEQSSIAERTVDAITKQINSKAKMVVHQAASSYIVTNASVVLDQNIPRELNRKCLTRLKHLGEGEFGEVSQYQVFEPKLGIPAYLVAAKSVRPGAKSGRDDLLKEAALMALMDHRNVVGLVGVVTIPRNLPALILISYCEGGVLLDHLIASREDGLPTATQLTYIAQIALGLQYIASRMIVHRDIAARNVLLDATGCCKVSDFGMSVSLASKGEQEESQYIRLNEEIAIRWAAPEIINDQKFSVASDVWAFGVLCWEIFSGGKEPYHDLKMSVIPAFVADGGRLSNDDMCVPPVVYKQLLLPCWSFEKSGRPTFGHLYDLAVLHGAQEDDEALEERMIDRLQANAHKLSRQSVSYHQSLAAPSVFYLSSELVPEITKLIAASSSRDYVDPTSYHVKDLIVLPRTKDIICSRDGQLGGVFVDSLTNQDSKGPATCILSYAWQYPIRLVAGACSDWCASNKLNPKRQCIWIDVLCWNQHGRLADPVGEWKPRVESIGHQLTMLHPWNKPVYTTRAWCIFEIWFAMGLGKKCDLSIILAPEDRHAFIDAVRKGGYNIVDSALKGIQSESAEAYSADDLAKIRAMVEESPGGYEAVNSAVRSRLARWFQTQGGIRVVDGLKPGGSGSSSASNNYSKSSRSGNFYSGNSTYSSHSSSNSSGNGTTFKSSSRGREVKQIVLPSEEGTPPSIKFSEDSQSSSVNDSVESVV